MEKKISWLIVAAIGVQVAGAWCIDVMDVDSAQYASISLEMFKSKNFLQVFDFGRDYLDKPPLLFWASSFSFWILGVSQFTFRILPLLLSVFVGGLACYRFCTLFYNRHTANLAMLFYLSSQTVFLMAFDLRTDSLLTSFVMLAISEFARYMNSLNLKNLFFGAVALGLAMLAKGPVGLVVVVFALGSQILMTQNWKMLFNWHWLIALVVVLLILLPMNIGLYQQFDLHPEKLVNGLKGVSGLRFFYWGQSFGRITGESPWKNDTDKLFLVHSYLWSCLPWSLITLVALFFKLKKIRSSPEFMTIGGFLLTIIALSFSAYKLPHYINVIIPFGSILSAWFIDSIYVSGSVKLRLPIRIVQGILLTGLWLIMTLLALYVFPMTAKNLGLSVLFIAFGFSIYYWFNNNESEGMKLILPSAITIISVNLFMNTFFYPNLLQYQAPSVLAKFVVSNHIPQNRFYVYGSGPTGSMDFYIQKIVPTIDSSVLEKLDKPCWLYIPKSKFRSLQKLVKSYTLIKEVPNYPVTRLNIKFLNRATRPKVIEQIDLVKID